MSTTFFGISIDATDAFAVAAFWAAALGRPVAEGGTVENATIEASEGSPRIGFHRVPEPRRSKNRLHLDLIAGDYDTELQRLHDLGATTISEVIAGTAKWTTLGDIEGNEFDLIAG